MGRSRVNLTDSQKANLLRLLVADDETVDQALSLIEALGVDYRPGDVRRLEAERAARAERRRGRDACRRLGGWWMAWEETVVETYARLLLQNCSADLSPPRGAQ